MTKPRRPAGRAPDDRDVMSADAFGDPSDLTAADELEQVFAELDDASGCTVRVERIRQGRRPEFVAELSAAEFSLPRLQEQFGGGEYALTVRNGLRQYIKRRTVAVAQQLASPKPASPPAETAALEKIVAQLAEQQKLLAALLMARPAHAAADPAAIRTQILGDMKTLREIIGGSSGSSEKLVEAIRLGADLAKDGEGGEGWVSVVNKVLDVFGPSVAEIAKQVTDQAATRAAASQSPGVPTAQLAQPQGNAMPPQQSVETSMMGRYLPLLVQAANDGSDPGLYAELIVDRVPEEIIRRYLDGEGSLAGRLAQFDPRVAGLAQWFEDLGASLRELLSDAADGTGGTLAPGNGEADQHT